MKIKWYLVASIFELIIGMAAVVAFIVLCVNGENMMKWIVTLILSVVFIVLGIVGIKNHMSEK